ncbi:hypothetical protein D3C78_1834160 [compost metagenome]
MAVAPSLKMVNKTKATLISANTKSVLAGAAFPIMNPSRLMTINRTKITICSKSRFTIEKMSIKTVDATVIINPVFFITDIP